VQTAVIPVQQLAISWTVRGLNPGGCKIFQTGPKAHPASCTIAARSFLAVRRTELGADHPAPYSARSKWVATVLPCACTTLLWGDRHLTSVQTLMLQLRKPCIRRWKASVSLRTKQCAMDLCFVLWPVLTYWSDWQFLYFRLVAPSVYIEST
jgi:hypothetical protein